MTNLYSVKEHSPIADLAFKTLIIFLHYELAFLKIKDSIIRLASEFGIILFTAEVNVCKKKSVNVSFGSCITLVND